MGYQNPKTCSLEEKFRAKMVVQQNSEILKRFFFNSGCKKFLHTGKGLFDGKIVLIFLKQ